MTDDGYTTVNRRGCRWVGSSRWRGAMGWDRGAGGAFPFQSQVGIMSRNSGTFSMFGGGEAKVRFPICFFSCNAVGLMLNFAKVEGRLPLLTRPLFSGLWQCQSLVRCLSGTYPLQCEFRKTEMKLDHQFKEKQDSSEIEHR